MLASIVKVFISNFEAIITIILFKKLTTPTNKCLQYLKKK